MTDFDERGEHGDWHEYRRLVLSELRRLERALGDEGKSLRAAVATTEAKLLERLAALQSAHAMTRDDVIALKVKAGVWGMLGGTLSGLAALLIFLATR